MEKGIYQINRKKVMSTTYFVPFAIPIFGLFMWLSNDAFRVDTVQDYFIFCIFGLFVGAIIWIPAIIMCLLVELITINSNASTHNVVLAFLIEAFVAFFVIILTFGALHIPKLYIPLAGTIVIAQGLRYFYLLRKDRMFTIPRASLESNILDNTSKE